MAGVADESLWPPDLAPAIEQVPPVTILKLQAALLGQTTKNLVEGEVETEAEDYQRLLKHTLFLVAPALNFYRYPLIEVEHPATRVYPAKIKLVWIDKPPHETIVDVDVADEKQFKEELRKVFANEETKRIIGALLAQSMGQKAG